MQSIANVVGSLALGVLVAGCANAPPVGPHDHGRQKTGAPTVRLGDEERMVQQCRAMMAEMGQGRHDHGRQKTGAPNIPPRRHDPADLTHERCREVLSQADGPGS